MTIAIAVLFPLKPDPEFSAAVAARFPSVELRWTPYIETAEMRAIKGANGGRAPTQQIEPPTEEQRAAWSDVKAIIGMDLRDDAAELFPALEWFQATTAGVDHLDTDYLKRNKIALSTGSGVASVSIAEFVLGRILQEYKYFRTIDEQQSAHEWRTHFGSELNGKTMGIIGFGAIGRALAVRARAFGVRVIATRGSAKPGDQDPDADEIYPASALDEVLPQCDIVVAALPTSPSTTDLFDAEKLALMPEGSVFCNVGRGANVVEGDLIVALERGKLRAAILDVAKVEPLPADDPLWNAPNLYLSPHTSVSLDRYQANVLAIALQNIERFLASKPLVNASNLR